MNARQRSGWAAAVAIATPWVCAASAAAAESRTVKVVYHVNESLEQATNALRNIRNHLSADPAVKITVVAHSAGIDFLLDGAKDKNGNLYDALVQDVAAQGVDFRLCNFTLIGRKLDKSKVIPDVSIVASGVAEVARLQAQEQYVYLRP